ncbi:CxxC-x17-CxxC domain-containing protein [Candidatus Omnitrophota bacterium]
MKKRLKRKIIVVASKDEPGAAGLINKVQEQLSGMEKKLDILISQSSQRPLEKSYSQRPFEKNYSQKPFRSFNHPQRHDRGRQDNGSRERTFTRVICSDCKKECEIPFKPSGGRPVYCKECFSKRKQGSLFSAGRDSRPEERGFPREHRSVKRHAEKRHKPVTKKPFFAHRKKRV